MVHQPINKALITTKTPRKEKASALAVLGGLGVLVSWW
jgi:hypothetical protein